MIHPMLAQKLKKLNQTKNIAGNQKLCSSIHPARISDALAKFSPQRIGEILSVIKPRMRATIFSYLAQSTQTDLVEFLKRKTLIEIVAYMPADRRVDFFNQLPAESQELLLPALAHAERENILKLAAYPPETAGAVMTSDYATIPMLTDTGGNTGSQSSTLVVRALAVNEITPRETWVVLLKEAKVAILIGILLGIFSFARVILFGWNVGIPEGQSLAAIGAAIAAAMGFQVITATLIVALLPLAAAKLKLDPAVVASPTLTTIVDITGLLIFFVAIKMFLGI